MSNTDESVSVRKKGIIASLLMVSCALTLYLLWATDPKPVDRLHSPEQIDSLITETLGQFDLSVSQVRTQNIRIDSTFSRRRYVVEVDPGFSKTTFHYNLHNRIRPFDAKTIGNVYFPDRDLQIHIAYNGTIHRTVFLYSENDD